MPSCGGSPHEQLPWFPPLALGIKTTTSDAASELGRQCLHAGVPPMSNCRGFPHSRFAWLTIKYIVLMQSLMGETPKTALHRFLIPHTPHPTTHTPHLRSLLKTYPCEPLTPPRRGTGIGRRVWREGEVWGDRGTEVRSSFR